MQISEAVQATSNNIVRRLLSSNFVDVTNVDVGRPVSRRSTAPLVLLPSLDSSTGKLVFDVDADEFEFGDDFRASSVLGDYEDFLESDDFTKLVAPVRRSVEAQLASEVSTAGTASSLSLPLPLEGDSYTEDEIAAFATSIENELQERHLFAAFPESQQVLDPRSRGDFVQNRGNVDFLSFADDVFPTANTGFYGVFNEVELILGEPEVTIITTEDDVVVNGSVVSASTVETPSLFGTFSIAQ